MAVFGVPVLHEDDALRALRAASELRDDIERLNEDLEQVYGLRIAVRIGVNSGEVVAGDTIRGHSFAAGDAVNVAQRLEAAAEAGRDPDRRRDLPARPRRRPGRVSRAAGAEGKGGDGRGAPAARGAAGCPVAHAPLRLADGRARAGAAVARRRVRAGGSRALLPSVHRARRCGCRQVEARPGGAGRHRRPRAPARRHLSAVRRGDHVLACSRGRQAGHGDRGRRLRAAGADEDRGDARRTTRPRVSRRSGSQRSSASRRPGTRPRRASGDSASSSRRWRASARR